MCKGFLIIFRGKSLEDVQVGKRKRNTKIMRDLNATAMNLVQKVCSNGHYGFHSLKVSAVFHINGIRHTHCESLRMNYYVALYCINMIEMIKELK